MKHVVQANLMPAFASLALDASAQVTRADYDRAQGLRDQFERLAAGIADPPYLGGCD